jgi:hypothetical protein
LRPLKLDFFVKPLVVKLFVIDAERLAQVALGFSPE